MFIWSVKLTQVDARKFCETKQNISFIYTVYLYYYRLASVKYNRNI